MKRIYSKLKDKGKNYFFLKLFFIVLMGSQMSWGQIQKQIIGSYPVMDGGFEGQVLGLLAAAPATDTPHQYNWTNGGGSNVVANIDNTANKARSGSNCLSYTVTSGGRYVQGPLVTPMFTSSTDYIVQFYYKSSTDPGANLRGTLNLDSKKATTVVLSPTFTADTWLRASIKITSGSGAILATNWAGFRDGGTVAVSGIIDDFVVYQGSLIDLTAPDPATSPAAKINGAALDISWKAPGTGVDGGGYMVVRYDVTPNADNDPNVNGIYALNNTIRNGAGALAGKVVFIGTATSFQDATVVSNTNYYYKIYTVDKAFNYSNEIVITGNVNAAPVAFDDAITVAEGGTSTTLDLGGTSVLANDTDADNNILKASLVSNVAHGALTLNADGTFSYVHDGSETISDSFTYKSNDGYVDSNVATVNIVVTPVNDAPVANPESITVFKGGTVTVLDSGSANVLTNDTDIENNALSAVVATGPTHGSLILNADGTFSYTHDGSSTTSDSFTYKANDGNLDSVEATVSITVTNTPTLSYTPATNVFSKGIAISQLKPTLSGGLITTSYSVSPSLPDGLSLDPTTGIINGTPTAIITKTDFVVTVNYSGDSTTATVSITVNDIAPSGLSYTTPNVFTKETAITTLNPNVGGGAVVSYSVSPSLPAGLIFNATTGAISGTPTAIATTANYTVKATNTGGSTTTVVSITVNDIPPSGLSYTTPNVFTKGTAVATLTPTVGSGIVVSYSVSPSLPAGLILNTTSGAISGIPTVITNTIDYTVTAINTAGSTTATISIRVNDVAPTGLSYTPSNVFTKGSAIQVLTPAVNGAVVSYSVVPALPAGLSLDTTTGVISGTPTAVIAGANYTVTATNTGGSTTALVSITVIDVIPDRLSVRYITPNVFARGTVITALTPKVNGGTVISYSVSPSLPAGLSLDAVTGVISGTPTVATAEINYTVTATSAIGNATATVSIRVDNEPPAELSYPTLTVFKKDRIVEPIIPSISGGPVVTYTVSPSLPSGLRLNATTGVISGTAKVVTAPKDYVITATNMGGSTSITVTIEVLDISLKVSQAFTPNGDGINDFWVVHNIVEYPNSIVRVFNTNGVQVFHSNQYQNNWDGHNEKNNQELPVGSYLFQIDLAGDGTIDNQGWLYIAK